MSTELQRRTPVAEYFVTYPLVMLEAAAKVWVGFSKVSGPLYAPHTTRPPSGATVVARALALGMTAPIKKRYTPP